MSDLLHSVDLRTQLAGNNRMELLSFYLNSQQKYGINVFKIREVIFCPEISTVVDDHLCGIVYLRGVSVGVIDLNDKLFGKPCEGERPYLIITEFSSSIQALLVRHVDRILNLEWQSIDQPPPNLTNRSRITATTEVDGELIQILDLEQVVARTDPEAIAKEAAASASALLEEDLSEYEVVYCDDSGVAREGLKGCLDAVGVGHVCFENGRKTYNYLLDRMAHPEGRRKLLCLISDIEMPELDGFTLTHRLRERTEFRGLPIYLHSSLSGASSAEKALQVGANGFIAKFHPEDISAAVASSLAAYQDAEAHGALVATSAGS